MSSHRHPNLSQLQPQTSTNYQAVVVYHGSRISFDADDNDFKNKLQTASLTDPVLGLTTETFNLGGAAYRGVEGALTFRAADHVLLFSNGSINSAKTHGAITTILGVPVTIVGGKQIAGAPKSTAAVGAYYQDESWTASIVDKYTGVAWGAEREPAAYKIPGYNSTDLTVVYRFDG